jgi:succinate dehydrogenase hydrophobic anchor subunit
MMEQKPANSIVIMRWLMQASLGVLLVLLLAVHLIVNHWVAPHGLLTYKEIIQYYDLPGIVLMESILLITVTIHCLLGLHSIILDLNLRPIFTIGLTWLLTLLGFTAILYCLWLAWIISRLSIS